MTRTKILTSARAQISKYRKDRPAWFKRSISDWLLRMRREHENTILTHGCGQVDDGEHYFTPILMQAAMCMDDNGVLARGCGPPLEGITQVKDSDLDLVMLTVFRECDCQVPATPSDYAVRIDCHLRSAFEALAAFDSASALDSVRCVASLAVLGIENNPLGE